MSQKYDTAIMIKVRHDLHDAIVKMSKRRQVPVSVMVREFLKAELAKEKHEGAAAA
jgi:hypothetical protein